MIITSKRYLFGDNFTLSHLAIDGIRFAPGPYILEDKVREVAGGMPVATWKIPKETAIPVGRYRVEINMSARFVKRMIQLMDVPGYSGIRVHAGNTSHDTDGCMVTGKERDEKHGEVSGSRQALALLFPRVDSALQHGEPVWWVVEGLP